MARKTDKTQMNEESSRSHLILTILIDIFDQTNQKTTKGKI